MANRGKCQHREDGVAAPANPRGGPAQRGAAWLGGHFTLGSGGGRGEDGHHGNAQLPSRRHGERQPLSTLQSDNVQFSDLTDRTGKEGQDFVTGIRFLLIYLLQNFTVNLNILENLKQKTNGIYDVYLYQERTFLPSLVKKLHSFIVLQFPCQQLTCDYYFFSAVKFSIAVLFANITYLSDSIQFISCTEVITASRCYIYQGV